MAFRLRLFCALALLSIGFTATLAQSPPAGHIGADSYTNSSLKFSYSWPKSLFPVDKSTLNIPAPSPGSSDAVLFSARQGNQPAGVIILALKQGGTPQNPRFKDGDALLDQVISHFGPDNHFKLLNRSHPTNPAGIAFDEVDYQANGLFSAGVVTRIGDYFIVYRITAMSASDLAEMTKSAVATRRMQ